MRTRMLAALWLVTHAADAAQPAGLACPVPRSPHPRDEASLRKSYETWKRPPDCCGVAINRVEFSAAGVVCWPLLDIDEVEAKGWPVAIVLFDGSRIHLSEGSSLKLEARDQVIRFVNGTIAWQLPPASKRRVIAQDKPLGLPRGMAQLRDGKLQVLPNAPFPDFAPDVAELMRRFLYSAGRMLSSDEP